MRPNRSSALSVLLAAFALATPALAGVLVVDPANPQAFAGIQAAVDASADGDVVLVKAGTYSTFQVFDRSIAIVADAGAAVLVEGAVRVRGLAASRQVVLSGLDVTGVFNAFDVQRHGLYVKNCAGSVRAIDCAFRGAGGANTACVQADGAVVEGAQDVAFERCTLAGRGGDYFTGRGLQAHASRVALHDSTVLGGQGGWNPPCTAGYLDGGDGGAGAVFQSSSFGFAQGSQFTGGDGGPGTTICGTECFYNGSGGHGLHALFGSSSSIVELDSSSSGVVRGPCQTCFGLCQGYCLGHDGAAFGNDVRHAPGARRVLDATRVAREGQTIALTITGAPGDVVELGLSTRPAFRVLAGDRGVSLLGRRDPPYVMQLGTVPASGTLVVAWTLNDLGAGVEGFVLHAQAALVDVQGQGTFTGSAQIALLDAGF
jgi:hypothetical protein